MSEKKPFEIHPYQFTKAVFGEFQKLNYARNLWPVVYILSDERIKEAYVGETTDAMERIASHLDNTQKNKLTRLHVIESNKFNKSATLDIESNLIKYISADGKFKLLNGNIGLANHSYYQKGELYWDIFKSIWDRLRRVGFVVHSLEYVDNSDLFKYSPYKSLTRDQKDGLIAIINGLLNDKYRTIFIEGGAGTGKTILSVYLFKLLYTDFAYLNFKEFGDEEIAFLELIRQLKNKFPNPKCALVVPMSSFRKTMKKVFQNVKGLSSKMVIAPSDVAKENFDLIVVDESHRLRRRVNLTNYKIFDDTSDKLGLDKTKNSELDWILKCSRKQILFYDSQQSIKPTDISKTEFDNLKDKESSTVRTLNSQFRVRGGNDYIAYVKDLLDVRLAVDTKRFKSPKYEFAMFNTIDEMLERIIAVDKQYGLARVVAGYAWPWKSKNDKSQFDIKIENTLLQWNSTAVDWVYSENAINEVGCIHTTQGYDLNYTAVIFGKEITYDISENKIKIVKENYHDINGWKSITDEEELRSYIVNIYRTLMFRGIRGTYVYACDKKLRDYFAKYIPTYISQLTEKQKIGIVDEGLTIPLYDLKVAAGNFSDPQSADSYKMIPLPPNYNSSEDYFACKITGESMNRVIPNGAICLFKKDSGGSRNGKIVLVQHADIQDPDFAAGYTIKEYYSEKINEKDSWEHSQIKLLPLSNKSGYFPIQLRDDSLTHLKVIGIFVEVLSVE